MNQNRREFLTGAAWMGAAAMAAGCMSQKSAMCGLGGGVGGYSLTKGMTPSGHKTSVDDDAEEMAAYINKYRETGHPGML